jgi:hypothetical protein
LKQKALVLSNLVASHKMKHLPSPKTKEAFIEPLPSQN